MPKSYAVMIWPISAVMISIAALLAVIEDTVHFKRGTLRVVGDDIILQLIRLVSLGAKIVYPYLSLILMRGSVG